MAKNKQVKKGKKKLSAANKKMSQKLKKKVTKKLPAKKRKQKVLAQPKGYHSLTAYLIMNDAAGAIDFYQTVFGAKVIVKLQKPDGKIAHAKLKIGDSNMMVSDEFPEMRVYGPRKYGGTPVSINLYVKHVDKVVGKAISNGARLLRPAADMFWGDRCALLEDPYGHVWHIATHTKDISKAQLKKLAAAQYK